MKQLRNFGIRTEFIRGDPHSYNNITWDEAVAKAEKRNLTNCPNCKTKLSSLGKSKGKYCTTCEEIW